MLLHGVLNPPWVLRSFRNFLVESGYDARICGYGSLRTDLDAIAEKVAVKCQRFHDELPEGLPISLVGHSLGAILCRATVEKADLSKLHRVVMLAPPNRGSHMATRLGGLLKWLVPAIDDLSDRPESRVNRLSQQMPVETGVISANPDFVISEPATHLENETDHIALPGPHASLIFRKSVMQQTAHFLEHGRFAKS